ncbi:MAG: phosphonate metabolism protein/1,5-bisphosphokinase (PRPP-forming) PhnN, partial [Pseudomonadota bacterium]
LPEAAEKYPAIVPILVQVSSECLRTRLVNRSREDNDDITARLIRAEQYSEIHHAKLQIINNDGALPMAGETLVEIIQREIQ